MNASSTTEFVSAVPTPLQDQPWGFREFSVTDRDGNLVTFFEPPGESDPRANGS